MVKMISESLVFCGKVWYMRCVSVMTVSCTLISLMAFWNIRSCLNTSSLYLPVKVYFIKCLYDNRTSSKHKIMAAMILTS